MIVDCHKYAGVREFVSNQHTIPRNYPKKPRGKPMKYVVFDNGGTKFPTGYYNKCGKYKTRAFKVGTTDYESLNNINQIKNNIHCLSQIMRVFLRARVW